jgi:hypothetical protein
MPWWALLPLATVGGPMLFDLPLAFPHHLDARAVDQEVQPPLSSAALRSSPIDASGAG